MYKYQVIQYDISVVKDEELEEMLNNKAKDRWELFFVAGGDLAKSRFIFRKRTD